MSRRLLLAVAGLLAAAATAAAPASPAETPVPPAVDAAAYLVVGDLDGRELAVRDPDERRPIASITKLMTALVTLENASLDDVVTVAPAAAGVGESSIFLRAGERMTVRDLVLATLVPSANDAATALALHVGKGSLERFVTLMNARARDLGMDETSFRNPHGLDQAGHLSTARDVVRLLRAALAVPFIRRSATLETATIGGGRVVESTDNLLGDVPGIVGAKTGHTDGAGWSQVAMVRRAGVQVVVALLGAPDEATRDAGLARLLEWGLSRYGTITAVNGNRVYARAEVGWGKPPVLLRPALTLVRPVALDLPIRERVVAPAVLPLPVRKGQQVGEVTLYAGNRLVARSPLVADRTVERPGVVGRVGWYAGRAAHHVGELFH